MLVVLAYCFGVFGDRQGVARALVVEKPMQAVVLAFPIADEIDVVYDKMKLLDDVVHRYVIAESCRTTSGTMKKKRTMSMMRDQRRFQPFLHKIIYVAECNARKHLGFQALEDVRRALYIGMQRLPTWYDTTSIVITSDADETPNTRAVAWLRLVAPRHKTVTYEFASTMPTFVYSFAWCRGTHYAMATARTLGRELQFWRARIRNMPFYQQVRAIGVAPSGYHTNNFLSARDLMRKWSHAVPEDGTSMYNLYNNMPHGLDVLRDRMRRGLPPNPKEPRLMPGTMCGRPF